MMTICRVNGILHIFLRISTHFPKMSTLTGQRETVENLDLAPLSGTLRQKFAASEWNSHKLQWKKPSRSFDSSKSGHKMKVDWSAITGIISSSKRLKTLKGVERVDV